MQARRVGGKRSGSLARGFTFRLVQLDICDIHRFGFTMFGRRNGVVRLKGIYAQFSLRLPQCKIPLLSIGLYFHVREE